MDMVYRTIFALFLLLIFASSLFALYLLASSHTLEWDEAVYLTKARSWIENIPADTFGIYRPIGMPAFGWLFLKFGDTEKISRMFGVIFGALTLVFIFLLFTRIANIWIGLGITFLIASSGLFLRQAPQFLNDIPSAGFLFGTLWLIWTNYETAEKRKSIYFAPFLAALAFYLRYGTVVQLAVIAILTPIALLKKFKNKNGEFKHFLRAAVIFIFLMAPYFIYSLDTTGSLFGILKRGQEAAGRAYLGEGLVSYIKWLPQELSGPLMGSFTILGIIATFSVLLFKNLRREYEDIVWLGSIGVLSFFVTGLLAHAEARYVFFR